MRNLSRTTLIILIATMAVALIFLGMGKGYSQTPLPTDAQLVGKVWYTIDDSTKKAYFFQTFQMQGCPANIYIHDTMWQWCDGSLRNTRSPNDCPAYFLHDTLYVPVTTPPVVPTLVTIFTTQVPPTTSESDGQPITLGVKFRVSQTAYVKGIRFAKAAANTGQHTGYLYNLQGAILDSGIFINETATGWQTLTLTKNIQLTANTTYIAAYYSPTGQYSSTNNTFNTSISNGIITGLASGTDGVNGVYNYGKKFPTLTYLNSSYLVDVIISTTK